jgi:hypothetical protein
MIFLGHIKPFIEKEGLQVFTSFQFCGILQVKVIQRQKNRALQLICVRNYSAENLPYFRQTEFSGMNQCNYSNPC